MQTALCERWRRGRASWRPAGELITPAHYEVVSIAQDSIAKAYVVEHHYSRSMPPARFRFGLMHTARAQLVGVAVFSVPMNPNVVCPFGDEGIELGRLVLDDDVPGNGETFFVSRCFELLRREGIEGVVSFSDPEPRARVDGELVFPGHIGTVYQALNATYVGRSTGHARLLFPDATTLSPRALSKVRNGERGQRYVVEQLLRHGARPPRDGEDMRAWSDEVVAAVTRPLHHFGNHKYLWGLTSTARRALPSTLPYPRWNSRACIAASRRSTCSSSMVPARIEGALP